ncbi:MAG: sodium-translocating pyrophosphatase [Phycisphaerae bacterium]|nr:sodium-translocating pyrophosphatase [Phycisphaerae bacterium]
MAAPTGPSRLLVVLVAVLAGLLAPQSALASPAPAALGSALVAGGDGHAGGEANLKLPNLNLAKFFDGAIGGHDLLLVGLLVSALGMVFGLVIFVQLKRLPVHGSMLDISELIYETCKTYLLNQGRFLLILFAFIGGIMVLYFGALIPTVDEGDAAKVVYGFPAYKVGIVLLFGLIGMAGSYGVAWFGIRVNTFANSRTAFASLRGKPFPCYEIPLKAGMSIGMMLISVELLIMLVILLFIPGELAGPCLIGFAIGESLGAAALRIAGGIFTKIADIGSDLMKIVFKIKEDDARNPGVIADCTGDNAGDSVGPSADGFETYGVTGVALIVFIMLAINPATAGEDFQTTQVMLLVWLFAMRILMVIASALAYFVNGALARRRFAHADRMNFEHPLTSLVWLTSIVSVSLTYLASYLLLPEIKGDTDLWWQLATIITFGTLAGAIIPELVKIFTSTNSRHVREVVTSSKEGGASLNILSGLVAGNFSAYWLGLVIMVLMAMAWFVSTLGLGALMSAEAVFAFGLVAFGFLGMGPVTIAVDSYGPVTDNAQSVYELSMIEQAPGIQEQVKKEFGFTPDFARGKEHLEENDGAGNTFKATAKPVLIGTAVVGATTMIFSIIVALTGGLSHSVAKLSLLHPPFLLGLVTGGAVIYWFTGASTQAVTTGAYRAVEFIKANIRLEGATKASVEDSKKVVGICTQYAQKGMFNIFLGVFFATLAFAFFESFYFIGYLVSIALFGLYQAIFMANAGGAWDNAKKIVETELKAKGTDLHAATVVGDTVGDPFKDTSSVALNPVIKFTTLFGLLAVELAVSMKTEGSEHSALTALMTFGFLVASCFFVYRSFYGMQIGRTAEAVKA